MIHHSYPKVTLEQLRTESRAFQQVELLYKQTFTEEDSHLWESHSENYRQQVLQWVTKLELALFGNLAETLLEFQQLSLDLQCDVWDIIAQRL